eukprot:SAG11_NODE_16133_length_556_cov_0.789934_1_plen_75_part_10
MAGRLHHLHRTTVWPSKETNANDRDGKSATLLTPGIPASNVASAVAAPSDGSPGMYRQQPRVGGSMRSTSSVAWG